MEDRKYRNAFVLLIGGLVGGSVVFNCWSNLAFAQESKSPAKVSPLGATGLKGQVPYSEEEKKELKKLENLVLRLTKEATEHQDVVQALVQTNYSRERNLVVEGYESEVKLLEAKQREIRSEAIERFEKFLESYPAKKGYTPDAMFRLSELYFEKSYDDYLRERNAYENEIEQWEQRPDKEEPDPPEFDYEPSIKTMRRLVKEFPNYHLVDGAYYLWGYCLSEMGESDKAIEIYRQLLEARPDSRFASEVWTRIGNHHFERNELSKAQLAFREVLDDSESPYFDKALYKLAWTHYRQAHPDKAPQEYQKAVNAFLRLLDFNVSTKEDGVERGQDLRPEAIKYIAISYADEKWGGLNSLISLFRRIGDRPYKRDILMALAEVYFDQTRYVNALEIFELVQKEFPTHPQAPVAQNMMIDAFERRREFEKAAQARTELTMQYGEESDWYEKNQHDEEILVKTRKMISSSLYNSALFYHSQAQKYRSGGKLERALNSYQSAANAYQGYLDRSPHDKNLYELTFYLAECLYYSTNFMDAASAYVNVRDAKYDRKYRKDAALSVVLSYEKESIFAVERGDLKPLKVLGSSERKVDESIEPQEIPLLRMNFIAASDTYQKYVAESDKNLPGVLYKAAEVYYAYNHFDEARRRFSYVLERFPENESAIFASNLIVESYLSEKNFLAVEKFASELLESRPAFVSEGSDFERELMKFQKGAIFKRAEHLAQKGEPEKAAELYLKLVDDNPGAEFADRALNNAAVGYEKVRRYDSASKLYERLIKEYPKSTLAGTALFRLALNSERFFDFDRAIVNYKRLLKVYPKSASAPDALYNAALALENTQQYAASAKLYQRYCQMFPKREDAPNVCFRAGMVYEKMNDSKRVVSTYRNFISKYGSTKSHRDRIAEAFLRTAKAFESMGQEQQAMRYYRKAVNEVAKSQDEKSVRYGAEAQFHIVDRRFKRFANLRINGSAAAQKKGLLKKLEALKTIETSYREILRFKQLDWTLASLFRIGALYENVAETFINAPCPNEIRSSARDLDMTVEEVCEEYVALLEEEAMAIEDKAVAAYEVTINRAREFQVANQWTKKTLVALNRLRKAEWPLQKDAKFFLESNAIETLGLVNSETASGKSGLDRDSSRQQSEQTENKSEAVNTTPDPGLVGREKEVRGGGGAERFSSLEGRVP